MNYPTPQQVLQNKQQQIIDNDEKDFHYFKAKIIEEMNKGNNCLYVHGRIDASITRDRIIKRLIQDIEQNGFFAQYRVPYGQIRWSDRPLGFDWGSFCSTLFGGYE